MSDDFTTELAEQIIKTSRMERNLTRELKRVLRRGLKDGLQDLMVHLRFNSKTKQFDIETYAELGQGEIEATMSVPFLDVIEFSNILDELDDISAPIAKQMFLDLADKCVSWESDEESITLPKPRYDDVYLKGMAMLEGEDE